MRYKPFKDWKIENQALAFLVFHGVIFVLVVGLLVYMKSAPEAKP